MTRLTITINKQLHEELMRAATETDCNDQFSHKPSAEEYAAEIIESYMASRRLKQADEFINKIIPIIDAAMKARA